MGRRWARPQRPARLSATLRASGVTRTARNSPPAPSLLAEPTHQVGMPFQSILWTAWEWPQNIDATT